MEQISKAQLDAHKNPNCADCGPLDLAVIQIRQKANELGFTLEQAREAMDELQDPECSGTETACDPLRCHIQKCSHAKNNVERDGNNYLNLQANRIAAHGLQVTLEQVRQERQAL